jgi:hypothetical protein
MKRLVCCVVTGVFLGSFYAMSVVAQDKPIPPPPKVRVSSKELYSLHPLYVHAKVESVDESVPVRYEIGGRLYRRWGYPAIIQTSERIGSEPMAGRLEVVVPGYTIERGPVRLDRHEKHEKFHLLKAGAVVYIALDYHADGYWLVQKVLNRHDFAELKAIAERVALTGSDDTIGVKKFVYQLHMNPLQKAYFAVRNKVLSGEMTQEELYQQFTPEMIAEANSPNNADLVLGKE